MRYLARVGGREFRIETTARGGGRFSVSLDGTTREVQRRGDGDLLLLSVDGTIREAAVAREDDRPGAAAGAGARYGVSVSGRTYAVTLVDPLRREGAPERMIREGPVEVRAIMPGKVTALLVKEGEEVRLGQGVVVVEAMKMENELPAPKDGRVTRIQVRPGETVEAGAPLFTVA
jgi:biotin carboxyl carrier protein